MASQSQKFKNRRLFYVPGLISLSLFLPLTLSHLEQSNASRKSHALEVNWYSPEHAGPNDLPFPPVRQYHELTMTGCKDDNTKLAFAQIAIREMLSMNDTVNGLKIHFTDTARYESFVQALDICNREDALTYAPYESDLWILNLHLNPKRGPTLGGCIPLSHRICGTSVHIGSTESGALPFAFRYHYDKTFFSILLILIILAVLSFKKRH